MAKPMFTRDKGADQVPQQIKELQDAATQNAGAVKQLAGEMQRTLASLQQGASQLESTLVALQQRNAVLERELRRANRFSRSEEHTSELQSLMRISYAVFCLKKKKNVYMHKHTTTHM